MDPVCTTLRPDWDGTAITALGEFTALATAPVSLILFAASLIALRYRSQWGSVLIVVGWSIYVSILTMYDPGGMFAAGRTEGCVGSATLFIGVVAAICVAMILYTAPRETRTPDGEN